MSNQSPIDDIPEALVDDRRRVSAVWLIPLVAVVAAVWLGYRAYTHEGPLVGISFETAEGLEAGKTRVRFKDVDVGVVEAIELSPDLSKVRVRARLNQDVEAFLNDNTRFWVARPRLSGGQVSGLGTLLAGTYIGVDLSTGGEPQREFDGLETPPIVTSAEPGKTFRLRAETLGSLSEGSPVLYRGIEVGRVVNYALRDPDGVELQVFVKSPYDKRVGEDTRFWNLSGVSMTFDTDGLRLQTGSLASVLVGGIAFGRAGAETPGTLAADGALFELFADQGAAELRKTAPHQRWKLEFAGSIRGLQPGAPVEFRGIRIGEVIDFRLHFDAEKHATRIPVVIAIDPGWLGLDSGAVVVDSEARAVWDRLVDDGLRAQIKTANLVSGAQYVDLDFYPEDPPRTIAWGGDVPQLPTVPTPLDELRSLFSRIARLPLDSMGEDLARSLSALHQTMAATETLLRRLDRETVAELNKTLQATRTTLGGLEKVLAPTSPLQAEAQRVLQELGSAARSFRIMADYLERHPEALIRGKGAVSP